MLGNYYNNSAIKPPLRPWNHNLTWNQWRAFQLYRRPVVSAWLFLWQGYESLFLLMRQVNNLSLNCSKIAVLHVVLKMSNWKDGHKNIWGNFYHLVFGSSLKSRRSQQLSTMLYLSEGGVGIFHLRIWPFLRPVFALKNCRDYSVLVS